MKQCYSLQQFRTLSSVFNCSRGCSHCASLLLGCIQVPLYCFFASQFYSSSGSAKIVRAIVCLEPKHEHSSVMKCDSNVTTKHNYLKEHCQGTGLTFTFARNLGHMPTWALPPLARHRMKSFGQYSIMLRARAGSNTEFQHPSSDPTVWSGSVSHSFVLGHVSYCSSSTKSAHLSFLDKISMPTD